MDAIVTLTITDRIALTLGGLGRAVAARIAGGAMSAAMILLVWRRISRIEGQILGLLARFRAGRLRATPLRDKVGSGGCPRGGQAGGAAPLPRRFGWLLGMVPYEAACFAGQLRGVLAEPEMIGLLAATPQAGRVLAPLCRMLGIEADLLAPAGRGRGVADGAAAAEPEMAAEPERLARYAEPACATEAPVMPPSPDSDPWRRSPIAVRPSHPA